MELTYIKIYSDFISIIEELDNGQRGNVFWAILQYANGKDTSSELKLAERIAFLVVKNQIDRDKESYRDIVEKRRESGRKGASKRWSEELKDDGTATNYEVNGMAKMANAIFANCKNSKNSKHSQDKEKEKEEDKDKDKDYVVTNVTTTRARNNKPAFSEDIFSTFWAAYPKKVGKEAAKKAFCKVSVPVETLLTAIDRQKCSDQWTKDGGQFIPNPSTWLNQKRWEDELPQVSAEVGKNALKSSGTAWMSEFLAKK